MNESETHKLMLVMKSAFQNVVESTLQKFCLWYLTISPGFNHQGLPELQDTDQLSFSEKLIFYQMTQTAPFNDKRTARVSILLSLLILSDEFSFAKEKYQEYLEIMEKTDEIRDHIHLQISKLDTNKPMFVRNGVYARLTEGSIFSLTLIKTQERIDYLCPEEIWVDNWEVYNENAN